MNKLLARLMSAGLLVLSASCATTPLRSPDPNEERLTVGLVQKEIRAAMTQDEVASALGSPNIVTRDSDGSETWIYDKISSEARSESREGFATLILIGYSESSAFSSHSQQTLTVIIKFDQSNRVRTFNYHASRF